MIDASKIDWIERSSIALNSSSDCCAERPSAKAREKLAIMRCAGQPRGGLIARVAARKRDDAYDIGVVDAVGEQVVLFGQRQL